jgi:hypothetical protein
MKKRFGCVTLFTKYEVRSNIALRSILAIFSYSRHSMKTAYVFKIGLLIKRRVLLKIKIPVSTRSRGFLFLIVEAERVELYLLPLFVYKTLKFRRFGRFTFSVMAIFGRFL